MPKKYKFMIVAGEASGDQHGAKLVRALRTALPDAELEFFGSAGRRLREAGVEAVVDADGLSIVGLPEIARALPMFLRAFSDLKKAAAQRRPDAVILVDFPDFNLKLAKSLKKLGLTVVYYISPQLWAWRKYRRRTIARHVDLLLTILPFEGSWYAEHGISNVEYVGSPLAREVHAESTREEFCERHGLDPQRPIVSLLPGSRYKEVTRILPVMLEAASRLAEDGRGIQFAAALASAKHIPELEAEAERLKRRGIKPPETLIAVTDETYDALNASDAAAVASGTATLETGIIGTPMAIVYRSSVINYVLLRPLISVEHFGLINLIAEKRLAKELIQNEFTAEALADEILRLLKPDVNTAFREELRTAAEKLGHGGASARAAEAIVRVVDQKREADS